MKSPKWWDTRTIFILIDCSKRLWGVRQRNIATAKDCLIWFTRPIYIVSISKESLIRTMKYVLIHCKTGKAVKVPAPRSPAVPKHSPLQQFFQHGAVHIACLVCALPYALSVICKCLKAAVVAHAFRQLVQRVVGMAVRPFTVCLPG